MESGRGRDSGGGVRGCIEGGEAGGGWKAEEGTTKSAKGRESGKEVMKHERERTEGVRCRNSGSDDRCPTCRQRNSRAGEREMDDGSVIVWHCNVKGCANHSDYRNTALGNSESKTATIGGV